MKKKIILLSILAAGSILSANNTVKAQNTTVLENAIHNGKVSGHIRYYYMYEDEGYDFQDYYGSVIGAKVKYETAAISGFNVGIAFYTSQFLNDNYSLTSVEPAAGNKNSRYVAGLMDAANPSVNHITGLGELYLNYKISKTSARVGRMKLKTPFINPEDGRMIPTLEQGIWVKSKEFKNVMLQAGYINAFWNRSTSEWKSAENSLGYGYAQGKAPMAVATNAAYKGHTSSKGVYVASIAYTGFEGTKLQAWDYYLDNIMNVAYLQANYQKKIGNMKFLLAGQYIAEQEVGDGGNGDAAHPEYSYMKKDEKSQTFGAKAGVGYKGTMLSIASTKVTDEGRFLFPREWGKEPLFTFQKRERTDGSGNATATLITLGQNFNQFGIKGLKVLAGIGRYDRVDAKDWVLNKYGVPSYVQGNIDFHYAFGGELKGLRVEYLFARKYATGNTYNNANFIFRKNDLDVHNFIVNYNF